MIRQHHRAATGKQKVISKERAETVLKYLLRENRMVPTGKALSEGKSKNDRLAERQAVQVTITWNKPVTIVVPAPPKKVPAGALPTTDTTKAQVAVTKADAKAAAKAAKQAAKADASKKKDTAKATSKKAEKKAASKDLKKDKKTKAGKKAEKKVKDKTGKPKAGKKAKKAKRG